MVINPLGRLNFNYLVKLLLKGYLYFMGQLYFGYCDSIITPDSLIGLAGYAHRVECGFVNSGVLDDLYARALYLKSGNGELVIVTLDLCMLQFETADSTRQAISEKIQVPVENIMINICHVHSGPITAVWEDKTEEKYKDMIKSYLEILKRKIVAICVEAKFRIYKAKLYSTTLKTCLGYNRRYTTVDENGKPICNNQFSRWQYPLQGWNGVVDHDIPILMIERIDDGTEDFYFNQNGYEWIILFSPPYHPVIMGQHSRYISADYPGAVCKCIENTLGDGTKAMFLLGACGNTQPFFGTQSNPKAVQVVGNAIGFSVVAVLATREEIKVDELEAVEEDIVLHNKKNSRIKTQVFRVGEACIAAVSGECFTELGIEIRKNAGFKQTLIATNSNGGYGYLPTRDAFPLGGYEIVSAINMGYDEETFDRVVEVVLNNCRKLQVRETRMRNYIKG